MLTLKIIDKDGSTFISECLTVEVHPKGSDRFDEFKHLTEGSAQAILLGINSAAIIEVVEATKDGYENKDRHMGDDFAMYVTDSSGNTVMTYIS